MSTRLNLTPQELQQIINTVDDMRNILESSSGRLQSDTISIKRTWDDDQFEIFEDTVKNFMKNLKNMADSMETEKQRLIKYQREAQNTSDNYRN